MFVLAWLVVRWVTRGGEELRIQGVGIIRCLSKNFTQTSFFLRMASIKTPSLALSAHHRRPIFKARCKFCRKPDFLPSALENFLHRANFANRLLASNEVLDLLDMHFVVL